MIHEVLPTLFKFLCAGVTNIPELSLKFIYYMTFIVFLFAKEMFIWMY